MVKENWSKCPNCRLALCEDLVPVLVEQADGKWEREEVLPRTVDGATYRIHR
jgi:hypothetical protein